MESNIHWTDPLKKRGWATAGGAIYIPAAIPAINVEEPRQFEFFASYESLEPRAVEWQVQAAYGSNAGFPPQGMSYNLFSGAIDQQGGPIWGGSQGPVVCKFELGAGPNARVMFADLRNGRFSLGVQQFVKVSVARWAIDDPIGNTINAQCSFAPTPFSDAEPPVYSATGTLAAAAQATLSTPPGACWFSVLADDGAASLVLDYGVAQFYYDVATPNIFPPNPPWPVTAGMAQLDISNVGPNSTEIVVQWWVR